MQEGSRYECLCLKVVSVALVLVVCAQAHAQAYRWEDEAGNTFYGSTPPPNAVNRKSISSGSFSRYSSKRMLKGHGWDGGRLLAEQGKTEVIEKIERSPVLEPQEVVTKRDSENKVSGYEVKISNKEASAVNNIDVSFEFAGGITVPASGPTAISAGSEALYSVSAKDLPITPGEPTEGKAQADSLDSGPLVNIKASFAPKPTS